MTAKEHVHRRSGAPRVFVWSPVATGQILDLSNDVVSFTTSKTLTAPAGTFEVTVVPRVRERSTAAHLGESEQAWQALEPGALVSIGFDEPGGIMLGIVDRIGHVRARVGEAVRKAVTIRGRDFGALLARDQIQRAMVAVSSYDEFYRKLAAAMGDAHPLVAAVRTAWGVPRVDPSGEEFYSFIGASLQDVVNWVLTSVTSFRIPAFAAFGQQVAGEFFDVRIDEGFAQTFWSENPNQFSGSIHGFLRSMIDADFYELWIDTLPNGDDALARPVLIVRPKPFDDPRLNFATVEVPNALTWSTVRTMVDLYPHHAIPESEILQEDLGRSSDDAVSFYLVRSTHALLGNPANEEEGLFFPLIDTFTASRFGQAPYRADLSMIGPDLFRKAKGDGDYTGDVTLEVREARNRLFNWHRLNPFFESGTIRVWGRDRYRVGDKVYLEHVKPFRTATAWVASEPAPDAGAGLEFYVNAVNQTWTFGGHFTTTLSLERGYNGAVVELAKGQIAASAPAGSPDHFAET